jgi:ABC-2 type transport system ATP-binding protein
MINLRDISIFYNKNAAVTKLNFSSSMNSFVGILGHNGSGKSTLIKFLAGLLPTNTGSGYFYDEPIIDSHGFVKASLRKEMGILFQSFSSDDRISSRDNLYFYARLMGMSPHKIKPAIDDCLLRAGLSERASCPVKKLSHGMRRRLEVYRSFLHEPRFVILDEPSEGFDGESLALFLNFIKNYKESRKALILYASHRPLELEHCDRVIMMDNGEIIADAAPVELLACEKKWRVELELNPNDFNSYLHKLENYCLITNIEAGPFYTKLSLEIADDNLMAFTSLQFANKNILHSSALSRLNLHDVYKTRRKSLSAHV